LENTSFGHALNVGMGAEPDKDYIVLTIQQEKK
jgi:hypothetical protein